MLGDVEEVHGARKIEVAVRVEGARELLGVHLEVGLDLELGPEHLLRRGGGDALAAEALSPFLRRAIGDEAELACEPQAGGGRLVGRVIAAAPGGVAADAFPLQRAYCGRERRRAGGRGDRDEVADVVGEQDRVGQRRHSAERGPHHRAQPPQPDLLQGGVGGGGDVLDGQDGEPEAVPFPGARIDGGRSRRAVAASERVHADDVEAIRVDRLARADHLLPPSGRGILRGRAGVRPRREAGEDEHGVVLRGRELAPRLVHDVHGGQHAAAAHREGAGEPDRLVARQREGPPEAAAPASAALPARARASWSAARSGSASFQRPTAAVNSRAAVGASPRCSATSARA